MTPELARRRRRRLLLWAVAVGATLVGEGLVLLDHVAWPGDGYGYWLEPLLSVVFFAGIGVVITLRRPEHRIGDVFLATMLSGGFQTLLGAYAHLALSFPRGLPLDAWAAVAANLLQFGFVLALLALLYLFPTGRLPSRRWRWLVGALVVGSVLDVVSNLLRPGDLVIGGIPNPLGWVAAVPLLEAVAPVRAGLMTLGILAALAAPIARYRRSSGLERLQLRWFAFGALAAIVMILSAPAWGLLGLDVDRVGSVVWGIAPGMLPLTAGIAVLRYRLYDISRIVRRTVAYTVITVVLAVLYASAVMALGAGLRPLLGVDSDLVVALSTLLVAAAFQPVRRRVQTFVSRRFDRARYDAVRTSERFGARLRDQVDMAELRRDLRATVQQTVHPTAVSIWLAPGGRGNGSGTLPEYTS